MPTVDPVKKQVGLLLFKDEEKMVSVKKKSPIYELKTKVKLHLGNQEIPIICVFRLTHWHNAENGIFVIIFFLSGWFKVVDAGLVFFTLLSTQL